jgi:hypothetical protein
LTRRYALGASRRFLHLLEDTTRLLQKQFARGAEFDSTRKTFEQFEANLRFQILNLPGERRLRYAKPLRTAPKMLFLADCHEIAQMS